MTSLKRNFLKKLPTDFFSEDLQDDVKFISNKVLKVSRRYRPPFLSYRENLGRAESACSSGARVQVFFYTSRVSKAVKL